MDALVADSGSPGGLRIQGSPDPQPDPDQALVRVRSVSLNLGECRRLAELPAGAPIGWDFAGTIEAPAANGSGPATGERVVGLLQSGAWAQRIAAPVNWLAPLPEGVSFEQAATLPVAGLTALKALDQIGCTLSRKLLVTGASGGVGRFAVQLASLAGAEVWALAGSRQGAAGLVELGAARLLHELPKAPAAEGMAVAVADLQFDAIIEGVGGATLGQALQLVAPGGCVVSFASSDPAPTSFPARAFFACAPGARLIGLYIFQALAREGGATRDLRRLLALLAAGRLHAPLAGCRSWRQAPQAVTELLERRAHGKLVLNVD